MFFCDPFGHTSPTHLFNIGKDDIKESDFVFMHDQEPVDVNLYKPLFDEVLSRNSDIWWKPLLPDVPYVPGVKPTPFGHVVVSERGEQVERLCQTFEVTSHYYFFHGWACLDWFRGYNRTFLIPRAQDRNPTKTFMSPNRIIGGRRDHRVLFLYHLFKNKLEHNHISAPKICTYENTSIVDIAKKYYNIYPDIIQVLSDANLPKLFSDEQTQIMSSCWLTNFKEAQDSLVYVPTETVYFGRRLHLTEKTFKAIALEMPFVLVATAGSLAYLREYGFKTFDNVFDESYDEEIDDVRRIEKVTELLKYLDSLSRAEREKIHQACLPIVEHNYNHFYHGGFAEILWRELTHMLNTLQKQLL